CLEAGICRYLRLRGWHCCKYLLSSAPLTAFVNAMARNGRNGAQWNTDSRWRLRQRRTATKEEEGKGLTKKEMKEMTKEKSRNSSIVRCPLRAIATIARHCVGSRRQSCSGKQILAVIHIGSSSDRESRYLQ